MSGSADSVSWTAMNPGVELAAEMNFGAFVFDLTDMDHLDKYARLMSLTRNVVAGEHKTPSVLIQHYGGKWVADGRYFVQVQWFQLGDPARFIPEKTVSRVRNANPYEPDSE